MFSTPSSTFRRSPPQLKIDCVTVRPKRGCVLQVPMQHVCQASAGTRCASCARHSMQLHSLAGCNSHLTAHHLLQVVHSTARPQSHIVSCYVSRHHFWLRLPRDVTASCCCRLHKEAKQARLMHMQQSSAEVHKQRRWEAADAASRWKMSWAVDMQTGTGVGKTAPHAGGAPDCRSQTPWPGMRWWFLDKAGAWIQRHGWLPAASDHPWTCLQLAHWPDCRLRTAHRARSAFA